MTAKYVSGWYGLVDIAVLHLAERCITYKYITAPFSAFYDFFKNILGWNDCICFYRIFEVYWLRIIFEMYWLRIIFEMYWLRIIFEMYWLRIIFEMYWLRIIF